ncbi:MAG: B12-binding domain-containing radical SAM protein [bacterium]|nr:B12-binding domain-containing radical SAM protein [bacterium]
MSPPLGLLYLAAYVREKFNLEIRLVDQRLENCSIDELARQVVEFEPDILGIGSVSAAGVLIPELTEKVRSACPDTLIALGGPHASASKEAALTGNDADLVVVGEGELTFERIIETYLDNRDYSEIPGLVRRESEGEAVTNPGVVPFVADLDSLPMPAYDLIDVRRYWLLHSFVLVPRRKYISLMSSRGCPFLCNYCHKIFGKRFRGHSPERLVDELEYFVGKYGARDVELLDDVFNYDYDRALEVCELIGKRDLKIKMAFPNGLRTDTLDEELIDAMVDVGFYYASFALESGSPRVQKHMGKRLDIDAFLKNVEYATNHGVFGNGFAMLGFPTETEAEMRETVDVMCGSRVHTGQFFTVTPFPGSELYDEVARTMPERLEALDLSHSTFGRMKVNLSDAPDEVLFACQREANRRLYLNPNRVLRLLRDHPKPWSFPLYVPMFLEKVTKGLFG